MQQFFKHNIYVFIAVVILLFFSFAGKAQVTWQGTTTNWNTTGNWSCTCTPSSTDDVIIPASQSAYPNISSITASARNITIASGASVSVTGTGVLQIAGSISNSGTFIASSGAITLNGSTAQTLSGSDFSGSTIKTLTISNTAGVSITNALNIAVSGSLIYFAIYFLVSIPGLIFYLLGFKFTGGKHGTNAHSTS